MARPRGEFVTPHIEELAIPVQDVPLVPFETRVTETGSKNGSRGSRWTWPSSAATAFALVAVAGYISASLRSVSVKLLIPASGLAISRAGAVANASASSPCQAARLADSKVRAPSCQGTDDSTQYLGRRQIVRVEHQNPSLLSVLDHVGHRRLVRSLKLGKRLLVQDSPASGAPKQCGVESRDRGTSAAHRAARVPTTQVAATGGRVREGETRASSLEAHPCGPAQTSPIGER